MKKAQVLIASVPHPKHNSERFFSFEEIETHPANVRNLWQCKILQRNHLSRPKERGQVTGPPLKTTTCVPSPSDTEKLIATSISVPSNNTSSTKLHKL